MYVILSGKVGVYIDVLRADADIESLTPLLPSRARSTTSKRGSMTPVAGPAPTTVVPGHVTNQTSSTDSQRIPRRTGNGENNIDNNDNDDPTMPLDKTQFGKLVVEFGELDCLLTMKLVSVSVICIVIRMPFCLKTWFMECKNLTRSSLTVFQ